MEESAKLFINGIKSSLNSDLLQQWVSELEDEIGGCKVLANEKQLLFGELFFFCFFCHKCNKFIIMLLAVWAEGVFFFSLMQGTFVRFVSKK
jgi:hypothetical protein